MQSAIQRVLLGGGLLALGLGCSSGRDPELLLVSPQVADVRVGERLPVSLRSLEEPAGEPEWEVVESGGGGLLQSRGFRITYLAPPVAGTYHLGVQVPVAKGAPLRQEVTIRVRPSVQVEPPSAILPPGGVQVFTLRQKGLPRGLAVWRVEEADGGTISAEGRYQAPAAPGVYHVSVACPEDPGTVASATVSVR